MRVWDSNNAENTKGEYHIVAGRINDIAWDGDSQRIIAVGDGKERYGHCITADSGNSVGEISGHSGQINCVSIRQQRPLRAATGSDDTSMVFYHGAPFKFNTSVRGKHDKYVYGAQFSPDGSLLVTVGADKKIWLYDGKTGDAIKQIGEGEHKGSIFGVSWAADSKRFVTCSGDQTVKIWDAESGKCTKSWRFGGSSVSVMDQQVGVTWPAGRSDGLIISLDLGGNLNYLKESSETPVQIIRGHAKAITAASSGSSLWTGSADGQLKTWDIKSGLASAVDGTTHTNYVSAIAASTDGRVYSTGWDDTLRTIDASQKSFLGSTVKLDGQPKAVAISQSNGKPVTVVASTSGIALFADGSEVGRYSLPSPPTSVAAHSDIIAIGSDDKIVRIFKLSGSTLQPVAELADANAAISCLAFSPNGTHVAAGSAGGKIFVFTSSSGEWKLETNRWSAHTARVTSVSWSPDGLKAVSGSVDTNVHVWSLKEPGKRIKALNAHKEGVSAVVWHSDETVISCGADAAVKTWHVEGI